MGLKILHSADWHLDSPFAGFDDSQRALLRQEQLSIPGKTAQLCRREKCDLMLLAGDIFDCEPARETVEGCSSSASAREDRFMGASSVVAPSKKECWASRMAWAKVSASSWLKDST